MALPWDRITNHIGEDGTVSNETEQAYDAFIAYRNQPRGDRSIARVAGELRKSPSLLHRWSGWWNWTGRAAAWDEHQQHETDEILSQARLDTNRAVHDYCVELRNRVVEAMRGKNLNELPITDLLLVLDTVNRHDRGALSLDGARGAANGKGGAVAPTVKVYKGVDIERMRNPNMAGK